MWAAVKLVDFAFHSPFVLLFIIWCNQTLQVISIGRRRLSADFQLVFRLIEGLIFLTFVGVLITLIAITHLTFLDIIVCILAFMPTGWGLLLVSLSIIFNYHMTFCFLYLLLIKLIKLEGELCRKFASRFLCVSSFMFLNTVLIININYNPK